MKRLARLRADLRGLLGELETLHGLDLWRDGFDAKTKKPALCAGFKVSKPSLRDESRSVAGSGATHAGATICVERSRAGCVSGAILSSCALRYAAIVLATEAATEVVAYEALATL